LARRMLIGSHLHAWSSVTPVDARVESTGRPTKLNWRLPCHFFPSNKSSWNRR
jgi:hypothetical protein